MAYIPVAPTFKARQLMFTIVEDVINPTNKYPPLYMNVNPSTFSMSYQKKINRYQTFDAYVEEYWGEELDALSCNGSTGGFILEDLGINTIYRTQTKPYFKFQDLLDVYRHNGNTYDESGRVVKKGNILISFDVGSYYGFFDSFNYNEVAEIPFRFTFDFSFKIERSYIGF
jgi:hypothetical protein